MSSPNTACDFPPRQGWGRGNADKPCDFACFFVLFMLLTLKEKTFLASLHWSGDLSSRGIETLSYFIPSTFKVRVSYGQSLGTF